MDTRTAVWVSTPEKFSKIVLGKTRNFSRKFRGVSAPALDKNSAVRFRSQEQSPLLKRAQVVAGWDSPDLGQLQFGPLGPNRQEETDMSSQGLFGPEGQKSKTESK